MSATAHVWLVPACESTGDVPAGMMYRRGHEGRWLDEIAGHQRPQPQDPGLTWAGHRTARTLGEVMRPAAAAWTYPR